MHAPDKTQPTLAALVDLTVQLDRDRDVPGPQRRQRDRAIGQQLESLADRPVAQTLAWLDATHREQGTTGSAAGRWVHTASTVIVVIGLLLGAGVAGGVFYYDGERPVNVIHVLAVFVGLQLLTVILTLFAAMPARLTRWLPGMGALQQSLWLISPGRLASLMLRWLPQHYRAHVEQLIGHARSHDRLYRGVHQWAILTWSQSFAVAFNLAALATAWALIVFSDLAFGWSTTLDISATTFQRIIVQPLTLPWGWAFPHAVPSARLIEYSHYHRLGGVDPAIASLLGQWWRFLVMCMSVYGLLPRLVLLCVALHRRRRAVVEAIRYHPDVDKLWHRMNDPIVSTSEPGAATEADAPSSSATVPADWPRADGPVCVIDWAQAPVDGDAVVRQIERKCGAGPAVKLEAGGARSVDEDARTIERAVGVMDEAGVVVMLVRAWEPPTGEVMDFLAQLRAALPHGRPIAVVPVGASNDAQSRDVLAPQPANLAQWQRQLSTLGDPWLHVVAIDVDDDAEMQT